MKEITTRYGRISLAEEVVATIAAVATTETFGVIGMSSKRMTDGIADLLGRENLAKGVEVLIDQNDVSVVVNIIVAYGVRISEVAKNIQEKVKFNVETMTGLKARRILVNVQGIRVARLS
jgi:uncharacterized alkaline shock family protein YloU